MKNIRRSFQRALSLVLAFASPMFGTIFSGNSSKTVYTSVQWEATKKAEEAIVPEDHYLLKGQIAKIGVKVTDPAKGNNPVQDTTVKLTANELNAPMTAKTNENGETIFTLTDTNAGDAHDGTESCPAKNTRGQSSKGILVLCKTEIFLLVFSA